VKKHTKLYLAYFGFDQSDFIPCEVCGSQAIDIHHIECRGMGGTKEPENIDNLQAVCRNCHIEYGDKKEFKEFLKEVHNDYKQRRGFKEGWKYSV
jgi:5-methylcytosine-specific restriction endonuclease McrA